MTNPYAALPDHCFWSRAMTWVHPVQIDPMTAPPFQITSVDRVATMGSCFAQHISRHLQQSGFNYLVTEQAPEGSGRDEARRLNYGVFSARYGNVYTVRQALQLVERAYGSSSAEEGWNSGGRVVDPYRPQIEPDGFASTAEMLKSRETHLGAVREMLEQATVLVFTLGLTEAWRSRETGAVFPTAPGVAGGAYDPNAFEPVNFTVQEVIGDLRSLVIKLREINPALKIILTVSPVPLKATFESRHVLQSTVYSKSVLRVAAQDAADTFDDVCYFPSFEIITGPAGAGRYYAADLREVRDIGVAHVMRVFERHFIRSEKADSVTQPMGSMSSDAEIVCDEDVIEAALQGSKIGIVRAEANASGSALPLSEREVRSGYRMFLKREPESQEAITAHRRHKDRRTFARVLLASPEFLSKSNPDEAARLRQLVDWMASNPSD